MKLVVIIGRSSEPLVYFANTINSKHKIDLLIIEKPLKNSSQTKKNSTKPVVSFIEKTLRYVLFKIETKRKQKQAVQRKNEYNEHCKKWFGNSYLKIDKEIPHIEVNDVNSIETQKRISEINPDLMLVHGGSLIKPNIISLAKVALNLHWGLSPYYRGINCTERALINWDIKNIGVTVHKLATQIDGGDVLGQARAKISNMFELRSATLQLTYLGTAIMLRALDQYKAGKELVFKKQDYTQGFLFKGLYWNENVFSFVENIDEALLTKMIKNPSRNEASIVELL